MHVDLRTDVPTDKASYMYVYNAQSEMRVVYAKACIYVWPVGPLAPHHSHHRTYSVNNNAP